ncbi:hypothetical protein [Peribacillus simplex]|uniref:hypothetical protein n=1 Tax=Peribacillus simplex TaxID=1478 RepID=UPI003D2CDA55
MTNTAVTEYRKLGYWEIINMIENFSRKNGASTLNAKDEKLITMSKAIDERAYVFYTTFLPRNSIIEVEFFARAISGKGACGLDLYGSPILEGEFEDSITITDKEWRPYRLAYTAERGKGYARVTFGQFKSQVGETEFRDIIVKVYNGNPAPVQRYGLIRKNGSSWDIHSAIGEFANDGLRYVVAEDEYIRVRFSHMRAWYRPIINTTVYKNGNKDGWHAQPTVGSTTDNEVNIYIYDKAGNLVKPKDITGEFYISFYAIAT